MELQHFADPPRGHLCDLPVDLMLRISSELKLADKGAMRALSQRSRDLVNATVTKLRLSADDLSINGIGTATCSTPLLSRYPYLSSLTLADGPQGGLNDQLLCSFLDAHALGADTRMRSLSVKLCHYLTRVSMSQVARCKGLRELSLSRWVDASALAELCGVLPELNSLDLGDEFVDVLSVCDSSLSIVARSGATLTKLRLDRCLFISDNALSTLLSQLPNLHHLSLSGCLITSHALHQQHSSIESTASSATSAAPTAAVAAAAAVATVAAAGASSSATASAAGRLAQGLGASLPLLAQLQVLDLSRCTNFGAATLIGGGSLDPTPLLPLLPSLQVLRLGGTAVQNEHMSSLIWQLPNLRVLHLGADFELNDTGLASLACLEKLEELTFGNFNICQSPFEGSSGGAERRGACFPKLRKLHFGGTFINRGIGLVFPLPCHLEELTIQSFDALRDHQMKVFARQLMLKSLKVVGGYQLTTEGLLFLKPVLGLRTLHIVCCPHITVEQAHVLMHGLPQVQRLEILKGTTCVDATVICRG